MVKIVVERGQLERLCRLYPTNAAAARALGVALNTFKALCQRQGVRPPARRA